MPYKLYDYRVGVKQAVREYQAVRIALDLMRDAAAEAIYELAAERGWDELAAAEVNAADWNLEATYMIRMYSVFERAVESFWRQMAGNADREVDGSVMLDEVGYAQLIDEGVIQAAQDVRIHRNHLVHRRFERHAGAMTIEDANRVLLLFLERLPSTWA